jgi:hypothetical protein
MWRSEQMDHHGKRSHLRRRGVLVPAGLIALLLVATVLSMSAKAAHFVTSPGCVLVSHESLSIYMDIETDEEETTWNVEYITQKELDERKSWAVGPKGTISTAEAKAAPAGQVPIERELTGLTPEVIYHVRATVANKHSTVTEEAKNVNQARECEAEPLRPRPILETGGVSVTGASAHLSGLVDPDGFATQWRFEYETSLSKLGKGEGQRGPEGSISQAEAEATPAHGPFAKAEGTLTGLKEGATYYVRLFAEDEPEWPAGSGKKERKEASSRVIGFETAGPPHATTFAVHGIHGEAVRLLGAVIPHGYDTHYRFQYVAQKQFEECGWGCAGETEPLDAGAGERKAGELDFPTVVVGEDLPDLQGGEAYEYRLVASNTAPGNPTVNGEEQALTAPAAPQASGEESCPNQAFRSGASARLPDCRAYEQLTPIDKEGSQEPFNYGIQISEKGALVGEDGETVMLQAPFVSWGFAPRDGQSPYFFSREEGRGWRMTAASNQPETGVDIPEPQIYAPNLAAFGFETGFDTSPTKGGESPEREYRVGPPGGPYATLPAVPRADGGSWVAASQDFSTVILQSEDHALLGSSTGTLTGYDLYEYSGRQLRQVNVKSDGSPIGTCGAVIVHGDEGGEGGYRSSPRAVSQDGSRVFFEEVPGTNCGEPRHLYIREHGEKTVDVGAYTFLAANANGSELLLVKRSGESREVLRYDVETQALQPLKGFMTPEVLEYPLVSEDLTTVYFSSRAQLTPEAPAIVPGSEALDLYRYDVSSEVLRFVAQVAGNGESEEHSSPNGRYLYFDAVGVGGVPGHSADPLPNNGGGPPLGDRQVYRYDSAEGAIECMSCASPFDPEPRTLAVFGADHGSGTFPTEDGVPAKTVSSANGDFAFFETPAKLVPQDVDGEVAPETNCGINPNCRTENPSIENNTSVSSDVYEWRRDGVDGCGHVQGCLSLITSGRGGFLTLLIGTAHEGRDVVFYTKESLLSQDNDTSGDIYDARIGGGLPPPPAPPAECKKACSTPASAPIDTTPASLTFTGPGNLVPAATAIAKPKAKKKTIRCAKGKRRVHGKCVKKGKAKKAARGSVRHRRGGRK